MTVSVKQIVAVLAVDDIERAVSFYRDRLGFTETRVPDDLDTRFLSSGTFGGASDLLVYKSTFRRGENTVATFIVEDVQQCVEELRGNGVTFEDYDLPGLKTENGIATMGDLQTAWFKDPDGNTIAISNDLREVLQKAA